MSKAMKYDDFVAKNGRKLDQENAEFEISSENSITPQECVNFAVETEDIYAENIISYAASGQAVAEASYVTFQVTKTSNAYYADGNGEDLWIASLGDFMEAMVQYKSAQRESYCEQCQQAQDFCYPQQDGASLFVGRSVSGSLHIYFLSFVVLQSLTTGILFSIKIAEEEQEQDDNAEEEEQDDNADDADNQDDNAENRKLKAFERKLSGNYVNCSTCDSLSCWEAEEEEGQEQQQNDMYMDDDELAEYVANFAGCAETGYMNADGIELRAGFICGNRDGKNGGTGTYGPEIGLFLDENCLVYYKSMDYYQLAAGGYQYYANQQEAQDANQDGGRKLEDGITYLTADQLSFMIDSIVEPYKNGISCEAFPEFDEYKEDGEEEEEQQEEEANYEANEICQQIMQADAVPLATCGYDNQEEQEDAEDEAEEEWEANEYNFMWEYELSQDDADDIQAVCTYFNTYDFAGYQGNVYSGEVHYKDNKTHSSMGDMSAGAKFGIAVLVLAIVGGVAFVALKKKQKAADDYKLEPLHDAKGASA